MAVFDNQEYEQHPSPLTQWEDVYNHLKFTETQPEIAAADENGRTIEAFVTEDTNNNLFFTFKDDQIESVSLTKVESDTLGPLFEYVNIHNIGYTQSITAGYSHMWEANNDYKTMASKALKAVVSNLAAVTSGKKVIVDTRVTMANYKNGCYSVMDTEAGEPFVSYISTSPTYLISKFRNTNLMFEAYVGLARFLKSEFPEEGRFYEILSLKPVAGHNTIRPQAIIQLGPSE